MRSMVHPVWWVPIVLGCAACLVAQPPKQVCLNEFLASNATTLADGDGKYDDWIELHNAGPSPVDVGGMFVTDDFDEPTRWRIPNDTIIDPGGFILIWADGDTDAAGLHASFKLSGEGEEIALFDPDGVTLVDHVIFEQQSTDVSLGRYPDGTSDWAFLTTPTPGASNAQPYAGAVADVTFNVEHGFFNEPFLLTLTTETQDARIWYTLDGTVPLRGPNGQFQTMAYDQPIRIDTTTVVRAMAVRAGWRDSVTTSCSYIFVADVQRQLYPPPEPPPTSATRRTRDGSRQSDVSQEPADEPVDPNLEAGLKAIPSVCLVIEPNDFFDSKTGINANPMGRGTEWERPVSVEWIDPENRLSFQVNAGLRLHGGVSRNSMTPKHSLRILFKGEYGPSTLSAPLFEDSDVTQFDSLVLRGTLHDSWGMMSSQSAQYMRDQFSRDTMRDMGRLTPHGRPVHVYINGQYWGLYILVERPDDGFAAAHLGGRKDQYDALKARSVSDSNPAPVEVVAGDLATWNATFALAGAGVEDQASYALAQQYLDVPSLIDYMLMIFYIGSTDGPMGLGDGVPRNFWAVRPRETEGGFVFLAWDLEFSLDNLSENRVPVTGTNNPHYLFHRLATNADFRMSVADHIHRRFFGDGALTPEQVTERYLARAADLECAVIAEAARWSADGELSVAYGLQSRWMSERNQLVQSYFPQRTAVVVDQLRQAGFYPATEPPLLTIDGTEQHGGTTRAGASLAMVNPNEGGAIYYTTDGTDPRMSGLATDANELIPLVSARAEKHVLVPTADIGGDWTGSSEPYDDTNWTAGTPVVSGGAGAVGYVEGRFRDDRISYNVGSDMAGRSSCYIRIPFHVNEENLLSLTHLALHVQCDDGFVAYLNGVETASINRPTELTWKARCVDRPDTASSVWLAVPGGTDLLRSGQNILAIHALDNDSDNLFLLSVELFGSNRPFASGHVATAAQEYAGPMELTESTPIRARVWRGGIWSPVTEAVFGVGPVKENLRITELMYHPPEPNEEFVELANIGAEAINLNLVQIVGGIDFVFPSLELAPGQSTLIVRDLDSFTSRYGAGLSVAGQYEGALSNEGEQIRLCDALGWTIMDLQYDDRWHDSRTDGLGHSLQSRDPFGQDPNDCSEIDFWRPSPQAGGSPGLLEDQ